MLASGTGARIVTSHDDVCLIEFQVPASQDFKLAHKEIDQILKRAQVRPLAVGVHNDRQLLQFCYTSEVADSALKIPRRSGITWRTAPASGAGAGGDGWGGRHP